MTTPTENYPANTTPEPATYDALVEMGFTGDAANRYTIGREKAGGHFVLTVTPTAGRFDSLRMSARILADKPTELNATASDMYGVRAFYAKLQAIASTLDATATAARNSAALLAQADQ
jgi:hypothetical protein